MGRQYLFMAIAWTMTPCLRYFLLCPEVLWFDVTSHSNNKGFCLLTFSCRTSLDKQVVFLWIWISNEQRMSFCWVFQHALSSLLPLHACPRVRPIMKDGDLQQRNEVMLAMLALFPNAKEASCGYHICEVCLSVVRAFHFPHNLFLAWLPVKNMLDYVPGVRSVPKN